MEFGGIQKMTLLDYPGLVACTVFTVGCNLRCPFCHNASLVLSPRSSISQEEVLSYLQKRKGVLDGLVVSGGEPLLHKALPAFLEQVKALGLRVKLDTNGTNPQMLKALVEAGLVDKVAMDIKNGPSHYAKTTGIENLDLRPIEQAKDFLLQGTIDYEFRTTVVRGLHTEQTLEEAAAWIRGAKAYFLQQFVDHGDLIAPDDLGAFTPEQMAGFLHTVKRHVPAAQCRGI